MSFSLDSFALNPNVPRFVLKPIKIQDLTSMPNLQGAYGQIRSVRAYVSSGISS